MPLGADELRRIDFLADVGDAALSRVAAAATEHEVPAGHELLAAGERAERCLLLLEGELEAIPSRAEGVGAVRHVAPTYMGAITVLTGRAWPVTVRAATPCRLAILDGPDFLALLHAERSAERTVIGATLDAMRRIEGAARRQDKLASLGTLSAGLAHELNNPAAAARSTVDALVEALDAVQSTLGAFVHSGVERAEAEQLVGLQRDALRRAAEAPALDVLDASEREDAMAEALEAAGIAEPWTLAEPLAEAGLDAAWLERVAELAGPAKEAAVRWVAASLSAHGLADDLRNAVERISSLVAAVKEYSYMDRGAVQEVDVHAGLESTLTILGHKLKDGTVEVVRDYDRSLPAITAHGSELNQVWTNLIDNALDAVGGSGTVTLRTRAVDGGVEVVVADSGPGIPPEISERIFDPFFTTKDVGEGTGLGLDTARRIVVDRHRGTIEIDGGDGRGGGTRARVMLPAAGVS